MTIYLLLELKSYCCVQRSAFQPSQSSYDSLYEEANNLLKNLHFQRMLRHGPESPEPSAGGLTQYKAQ